MNYYSFHIGDYTAHTAHLEPMEDLAYRRMLDLYYRTEQPLPRDIKEIARLIRLKGHEDAISVVIDEFFEDCADGWMHGRCDKEIDAYRRMGEGGKRGAAKRWAKPDDGQPIATPSPPQAKANANQEPVTNNQEPIEKTLAAPAAPKPPPAFDGKNFEALNGKSIAQIADSWELPEQWGFDAEALGFKPGVVLNEAEKFRQYWTAGKGAGTRRSVKGWRQAWSNWLGKAAERQR